MSEFACSLSHSTDWHNRTLQLLDLIDLAGSSLARARNSLRKGDDPAGIVLFMSAELHALALKLSEEPQHILFKRPDGTLTFDRYTSRIDSNLTGLTCCAKIVPDQS